MGRTIALKGTTTGSRPAPPPSDRLNTQTLYSRTRRFARNGARQACHFERAPKPAGRAQVTCTSILKSTECPSSSANCTDGAAGFYRQPAAKAPLSARPTPDPELHCRRGGLHSHRRWRRPPSPPRNGASCRATEKPPAPRSDPPRLAPCLRAGHRRNPEGNGPNRSTRLMAQHATNQADLPGVQHLVLGTEKERPQRGGLQRVGSDDGLIQLVERRPLQFRQYPGVHAS